MNNELTTGIPGLDKVLNGLMVGDNVVWEVESIDDYQRFVVPFAESARKSGRRLVYFRFAEHPPLLPEGYELERYELSPHSGFESFIADIHKVIEDCGHGAFYIFDSLSSLAADWYSDQMLGNFFALTCPYLYDLETITYFALFRNRHTDQALDPIRTTTQVFLDVYRHEGELYVRPVKTQHRHSPTINMFHIWKDDSFKAVSSSVVIAEITSSNSFIQPNGRLPSADYGFISQELSGNGGIDVEERKRLFDRQVRMMISRDERIVKLVSFYFTFDDMLDVRRRMIGTGLIGGKAVGMLLARAALAREDQRLAGLLEKHDSFYVGSDVFYTFLVRNGIWWIRQRQRNPASFLDGAEEARSRILAGVFPDYTMRQFEELLDYFGQYPFIVRSSSLLEDNYGNSFAGKYDSVFCVNQGTKERRLEDLLAAVRTIYAGCMSEKALRYRAKKGLIEKDEQMSLLIMRVSGALHNHSYYPHAAGVGFSFNPYCWSESIEPTAGVLRLVFGLGTRAVDRSDDDYTRIVALNAPSRRPEANFDEVCEYSQRRVDHLCLETNRLTSSSFDELVKGVDDLPLELFTSPAGEGDNGSQGVPLVLTFDRLLSDTSFVSDFRTILSTLQEAYQHPVDIEFTANFEKDGSYKINLLQCRPLHVQGAGSIDFPSLKAVPGSLIFEARGAVVGHSRVVPVDRIIHVSTACYGRLPMQRRYEVARLIGRINAVGGSKTIMLMGPGRWGTSSPSLGIPVVFSEICNVSILCEIVAMHEHLIPDVSLGTHFLNELVEMNMLYLALFPGQSQNQMNDEFFKSAPNKLSTILPEASGYWEEIVKVIDTTDVFPKGGVSINLGADAIGQRVICYADERLP